MTRTAIHLVLALGLAACGSEPETPWVSPVAFDTARVVVRSATDSASLLVEVAVSEEERATGLMHRPTLDPESGMLFRFDSTRSGDQGFWMWQTRMPLDIAFLDSTGVIVEVLRMEPCESDLYAQACPSYAPGVEYRNALEVNGGWFERRGFGPGDRIEVVDPGTP